MNDTLSALLAVVMVIIALGFAYQVFVFIRIFLHESTNFY